MKKAMSILCALLACLCMAACTETERPNKPTPQQSGGTQTPGGIELPEDKF